MGKTTLNDRFIFYYIVHTAHHKHEVFFAPLFISSTAVNIVQKESALFFTSLLHNFKTKFKPLAASFQLPPEWTGTALMTSISLQSWAG